MNHRIELEGAIEAARLAGVYLNAARQGEIRVLSAVGRNIKLQADRESESIILDALRAVAPHPVLAEESGEHDAPGEGAYWVVDPLDGSANFARGVPLCCVAIALMHGEKPLLGVVHDFNRDETLCGVVGEGAWLGGAKGAPIAVASTTDTGQAILATGFPVGRDLSDAALAEFYRQARAFKKVRMIGTAALALAYVARGWVDAYGEDGIMLWDVAAGVALVEAAGGSVRMAPSPRGRWKYDVRCAARESLWPESVSAGG
jgi:myo-inositol-1(or 4)-monophosphatase